MPSTLKQLREQLKRSQIHPMPASQVLPVFPTNKDINMSNTPIRLTLSANEETAYIPKQATPGAAGYDVRAAIPGKRLTILPGQTVKISLGFAMDIKKPTLGALLMSRSGHGHKNRVSFTNGVGLLDSDFQGEVFASVTNDHKCEPYTIMRGDRIGQLVFINIVRPGFEQVDEFTTKTTRNPKGFGTTGVE